MRQPDDTWQWHSAGPYATHLHLTPDRKTTTAPVHFVFYNLDAISDVQSTALKHYKHYANNTNNNNNNSSSSSSNNNNNQATTEHSLTFRVWAILS